MRVLVDENHCELQEYDFAADRWLPKDASPCPLGRFVADQWVARWNHVDRFAAVSALTGPQYEPGDPRRSTKRFGEPYL
jgi:hypothetical protein